MINTEPHFVVTVKKKSAALQGRHTLFKCLSNIVFEKMYFFFVMCTPAVLNTVLSNPRHTPCVLESLFANSVSSSFSFLLTMSPLLRLLSRRLSLLLLSAGCLIVPQRYFLMKICWRQKRKVCVTSSLFPQPEDL